MDAHLVVFLLLSEKMSIICRQCATDLNNWSMLLAQNGFKYLKAKPFLGIWV